MKSPRLTVFETAAEPSSGKISTSILPSTICRSSSHSGCISQGDVGPASDQKAPQSPAPNLPRLTKSIASAASRSWAGLKLFTSMLLGRGSSFCFLQTCSCKNAGHGIVAFMTSVFVDWTFGRIEAQFGSPRLAIKVVIFNDKLINNFSV